VCVSEGVYVVRIINGKQLVRAVGGPRMGHELQPSYLARVARKVGIKVRMVREVYYGEVDHPDHWAIKLLEHASREKDEGRARDELSELRDRISMVEARLDQNDAEFHRPDIGGMRAATGAASRNSGPVDSVDFMNSRVNEK
jgi:hypothetical protein